MAVGGTTPAGVTAQTGGGGQVELGGFGSYWTYDKDQVGLESKSGGGGWLGYYFSSTFSIEGVADYTVSTVLSTGGQVRIARVGGTFVAHTRPSPLGSLYLGVGYERLFYRGAFDLTDNSGHVIIGDRLSLGGRAALRFEGRVSYVPSTNLGAASGKALNLGGALGISIFAFGGPPRDGDGDGVGNKRDDCPNTPAGVHVDGQGCPTDGDGDAVYDGLDQCPGTPSGASVDADGCPNDTDGDGVLDGIDVCPSTPPGADVDPSGCPSDSDSDGVLDGIDQCADTPAGAVVEDTGCPIDSDGDGVFDGIDQCPNTAAGAPVDELGCPLDSDGDRVPDISDACPDTPEGAVVDQRGCQIVQDSDNDGVLNAVDDCPDTPAGAVVDSRGCPLPADSDGDGIADPRDRCPDTTPNTNVDAVGCPMLFEIEEGVARPLVLEGVSFES